MQLMKCHIAVGGDDLNVVVRDHDTAVTYPELLVIKALHGGENVREIEDAGDVDRDPAEERERLSMIYGREIVRQVFPGDHSPLPVQDMRRKKEKPDVFDTSAETETKDKSAPETKASKK
jgi:fructose-specific component phosphotransferase system IIB-like protein